MALSRFMLKSKIHRATVTQEDVDYEGSLTLDATEMRSRLNVTIHCHGGGITGQAGAACQGIARALKQMFGLPTEGAAPAADGQAEAPEVGAGSMAKKLRDSGYLTRDGRMKERKKYGRKGARKSFQFSKR